MNRFFDTSRRSTARSRAGSFAHRLASWTLPSLLLAACSDRLVVLDPPEDVTSAGSGGVTESQSTSGADSDLDISCDCGASNSLYPLGCGSVTFTDGRLWMSEDAQTVVYQLCFDRPASEPLCKPYRWTRATGPRALTGLPEQVALTGLSSDGDQVLISLPPGTTASALVYRASDDSVVETGLRPFPAVMGGDGSVIGVLVDSPTEFHLVRWTRAGGLQALGDVPFDPSYVELVATPSLDVIAGVEHGSRPSDNDRIFRWTPAGGVQVDGSGLPPVANGTAFTMSRDGTTLTGYLPRTKGTIESFAWTPAGGTVVVSSTMSVNVGAALLASADGSVIAGTSYPDTAQPCLDPALSNCEENPSAFRWTQPSGSVPLTPGEPSFSSAISADGSLIVGTIAGDVPAPFVWNAPLGARDLLSALRGAGADTSGWQLGESRVLSADARVVAGYGKCGGRNTIFRALVPE